MALYLTLPNGESQRVIFSILLSTSNLKITMEKIVGVPFEMQKISFNDLLLEDNKSLESQGVTVGSTLLMDVDMWWKKIVSLSLKGSTSSLGRRVSIPMQQIGEGNRIFVTLFICCTRRFPQGVSSLLSLYKTFDLNTRTKVTGRTLFHAAIYSGSLKCVEELKKHAGLNFEKFLHMTDKSGLSPLNELTDERMLHYLNKFLSAPFISIEQLENTKNLESVRGNENESFNTEDEGNAQESNKYDNDEISSNNERKTPTTFDTQNTSLPRLQRIKEYDPSNREVVTAIPNNNLFTSSISPIIVDETETSRNLRIGPVIEKEVKQHLPIIQNVPAYSPRPMRKVTSLPPQIQPNHVSPRQPHPPSHEKRKPIAGKFLESSLRKISESNKPFQPATNGSVTREGKHDIDVYYRHHTLSPHSELAEESDKGGTKDTEKKVRRISLLRSPRPFSPCPSPKPKVEGPNECSEDQVVIEVDQERIEKPWNNWIKAVTVVAEGVNTENENGNQPTENTTGRSVIPKIEGLEIEEKLPGGQRKANRKISFDQWVLHKARAQEMLDIQKQKEAIEDSEIEVKSKWKQGKSFDQWRHEKEEYEKQMKQQQMHGTGEHEDDKNKKISGKTYEEWQKEYEAKKKSDNDQKRKEEEMDNIPAYENYAEKDFISVFSQQFQINIHVTKAKIETEKARRRKESTAKYQQWLLDKERLEIEKQMKELKTKRKISSAQQPKKPPST